MIKHIQPGPGQESVWDYPRPPAVDPTTKHIVIEFNGQVIADTRGAIRILETSHPPAYYIPLEDINPVFIRAEQHTTFCEFKGVASYWSVSVDGKTVQNAAWGYKTPTAGYESIAGHLCFYASKMDQCTVDGEVVQAQAGDFYGGWITADVVGPFKGGVGTRGW